MSFAVRIPIAFGMVAASVLYFLMEGLDLSTVTEVMVFGFKDKFVLLAVPLFIFTARVMNSGGITERIFEFAGTLVGHLRGGLGHVNVVASIIFSGMTGSAIADASGLGLMEIKAMDDAGYERPFSSAITVASATIGPIIPPSIPMVIYAMLSGASVGALFLGGVLPGALMGIGLMATIFIISSRRGYERGRWPGVIGVARSFKKAFLSLMTPVILLGGIYSGAFTPTEAAAVAALYALVLLAGVYRSFGFSEVLAVVRDVVESTGFLGFIMAGAFIFGHVLAMEQVPAALAALVLDLTSNRVVLLLMLNLLFLVLGCFVDTIVLLLVVVPIVIPAAQAAGIDMVHLGVVLVINMMIGLATPPFGMLLFTISGLTGTQLGKIIREIWPFLAVLVGVLFLCTYFPWLVLWLPGVFEGG
jgi:tripartite ATP-independent transporter DctM subunit